jgi:hypothetical protein
MELSDVLSKKRDIVRTRKQELARRVKQAIKSMTGTAAESVRLENI